MYEVKNYKLFSIVILNIITKYVLYESIGLDE